MKGKHKIVVKNNRLHYEFEIKKKYHDNKKGTVLQGKQHS